MRRLNLYAAGIKLNLYAAGIRLNLYAAGGYLAALEHEKTNKHSSLKWSALNLAPEHEVAQCMQSLPRLCAAGTCLRRSGAIKALLRRY